MNELMVFLPCIAIAVFGVLWIRAGVLLDNARDERDQAVRDFDDLWQDYNALCTEYMDALDEADKKIAKLRWRLGVPRGKKNHMNNAFVFLKLARDSRVQGWKKMHVSDMLRARTARKAAHESGQGVP